jgi:hypothetical protein
MRKLQAQTRSGGMPAFPTLRLLEFLDCFTLKAIQGFRKPFKVSESRSRFQKAVQGFTLKSRSR